MKSVADVVCARYWYWRPCAVFPESQNCGPGIQSHTHWRSSLLSDQKLRCSWRYPHLKAIIMDTKVPQKRDWLMQVHFPASVCSGNANVDERACDLFFSLSWFQKCIEPIYYFKMKDILTLRDFVMLCFVKHALTRYSVQQSATQGRTTFCVYKLFSRSRDRLHSGGGGWCKVKQTCRTTHILRYSWYGQVSKGRVQGTIG